MLCPYCGATVSDETAFCPSCGAEVKSDNAAKSAFPDPTATTEPQQVNNEQTQPAPQTFVPQQQTPAPVTPGVFSQQPVSMKPLPEKSNVLLGLVGAVIFSLIGCAVWVLIGSLGYISYIGGLALSFLTITGYKVLGKKFDAPGIIICLIVIALAVFASNVFTEALSIAIDEEAMAVAKLLGYNSFSDILFGFFEMINKVDTYLGVLAPGEKTMMQTFIFNLVIGYVIAGIAFIVVAVSQFKASKNK